MPRNDLAPVTTDEFARAYVRAMLWAEIGDDDKPLDTVYGPGDLSALAWCRVLNDCALFERVNATELAECERRLETGEWALPSGVLCSVRELAAHDLWLTRNGHGCGFWDGDWPDDLAPLLTRSAESFGEISPYVSDDGLIHLTD